MGAWGVGPFDNDDAADFAGELDEAPPGARIDMIGAALGSVLEPPDDDPLLPGAERAVAAAALIAAQCPDGVPVTGGYGPVTSMPEFPAYLRGLAVEALDRLMTSPSWFAEDREAASEGARWRRSLAGLRRVLEPPQREALFDLS